MNYINICHKKYYPGKVSAFSSQLDPEHSIENILGDEGCWSSQKSNSLNQEYFIIDYAETIPINTIEISAGTMGKNAFPSDFRIEVSIDGVEWRIIQSERKYDMEDAAAYTLDIPVTLVRYVKFLILRTRKTGARYFAEIGSFGTGISGIAGIGVSSYSTFEHGSENLLDGNTATCWESEIRPSAGREFIDIDLGRIFYLNRVSLSSAGFECGFPEQFICEVSTDNNIWVPLFEEKNFIAEPLMRYFWEVVITPARFVRLGMNTVVLENKLHGARLSGLEISAARMSLLHTHNIGEITPHASIFEAGVVRLARDGEESQAAVVQGSDSRLRDASTIFKGIVQLAGDGGEKEGLAVQSSDSRLKPATELSYGVARLAYDREDKSGAAVQGNDSRLKEAAETSFGIVKLCPDGIYSEMGVVRGNDERLHKATTLASGICRLAEDGEINPDCAVQGNDRRLRDGSTGQKGIVELAEDGEDRPNVVVQGSDRRLKEATVSSKGIVELAEDGEDDSGVAVQGNDKRLKDASTSSKGIVELAEDGEDRPGVAVQGSDRRLRDAAETSTGISRFAHDGEISVLAAVQGSDRRLKDATTRSKGIVELAEDGEDAPNMAVQGSDRRLKDATTLSKGIVELAEDGEDAPDVAVQGSDRRLKDATTLSKGIVKLAKDGEDAPDVAVQGSDRRLKDATTLSKGIVELAEDGEDAPDVAVQGSDRRLRPATDTAPGIVRLAKHEEDRAGVAVQADDVRLCNPREPLPHTHEYAPLVHEYGIHTGIISVTGARDEKFSGIVPPPDACAVIHGHNESPGDGAIGMLGVSLSRQESAAQAYGVLGHSAFTGVRGQSSGNSGEGARGCGVLGVSRFGAGGVFASEHEFSLVAEGYGKLSEYDGTAGLIGNGDALRVNGRTELNGTIDIINPPAGGEYPANIVEMFEVDESDYIHPGDILVVSETGDSVLARSLKSYSRAVVGVVSGNPTLVLQNAGASKKIYPVVLTGKTMCRVDARGATIKPGDLIVSSDTPGCGMAGKIDSFEKIGTVIGKALDGLDDGIGTIPVFITHL